MIFSNPAQRRQIISVGELNEFYLTNMMFRQSIPNSICVPVPPLFGLGTVPPTFQDTDEEFAVIRGDLWRSNYTKTILSRGSAPDFITRKQPKRGRETITEQNLP